MQKVTILTVAAALAGVYAVLSLALVVAQTTVPETQLRPKIRVVEWYKCTDAPGPVTCEGLELYRFQLADGTTAGPFVAVPVDSKFVRDGRWIRQSE